MFEGITADNQSQGGQVCQASRFTVVLPHCQWHVRTELSTWLTTSKSELVMYFSCHGGTCHCGTITAVPRAGVATLKFPMKACSCRS